MTNAQRRRLEELRLEREALSNPFDRIEFDNRRDALLPGLPIGLWLLAFSDDRFQKDSGL